MELFITFFPGGYSVAGLVVGGEAYARRKSSRRKNAPVPRRENTWVRNRPGGTGFEVDLGREVS